MSIHSGKYISSTQTSNGSASAVAMALGPAITHVPAVEGDTVSDTDDERRTEQTSGTDDVVRDAFNVALNADDEEEAEDDEEQIVWDLNHLPQQIQLSPPSASTTIPAQGIANSPQVTTPRQLAIAPEPPSNRFPPMPDVQLQAQAQAQAPVSPAMNGTTALDLLNNVLGGSRVRRDSAPPSNQNFIRSPHFGAAAISPAVQTQIPTTALNQNPHGQAPQAQSSLLFGPGAFHSPTTKSIWGSADIPSSSSQSQSQSQSQSHPQLHPHQHLPHMQNQNGPQQQELPTAPMLRYGQGLGVGLPQHLAPGHERARSLSLSQAPNHHLATSSSQLSGTQDSIFGSLGLAPNAHALPAGVQVNPLGAFSQQNTAPSVFNQYGAASQLGLDGQGLGQYARAPGLQPAQQLVPSTRGLDFLGQGQGQGQTRAVSMSNLGLGGTNGSAAFGFDDRQMSGMDGFADPSTSLNRSIWNTG